MNKIIKPCPFCGGDPLLVSHTNSRYEWDNWSRIKCTNPHCCEVATKYYKTTEQAVNAWNKRA